MKKYYLGNVQAIKDIGSEKMMRIGAKNKKILLSIFMVVICFV